MTELSINNGKGKKVLSGGSSLEAKAVASGVLVALTNCLTPYGATDTLVMHCSIWYVYCFLIYALSSPFFQKMSYLTATWVLLW
ncbi:hypothetical protein Nmel_005357 [Mimus melanotis]